MLPTSENVFCPSLKKGLAVVFQPRKLHTFFDKIGISHHVSCPHMHQQNGFIERINTFVDATGQVANYQKLMMVTINAFEEWLDLITQTFLCSKGSLPIT